MVVRGFMVEAYQPPLSAPELAERARLLGVAAVQASSDGNPVRFARALALPVDEICFYLFEAESAEDAGEVVLRAGLAFERITEAFELSP